MYSNPYHNNLHAVDVTQSVHFMLYHLGFASWLTDLEIFAILIAAIIHDFQHTGTTNNFHVMSGSETAILYNDRAVLENFHLSSAFKIILDDDANILSNLSKEEYREFRNLVIEMVLATDMSCHFQQIKTMKSLLNHADLNVDKHLAMNLVLHCCDISHPAKKFDLHKRWTYLLMEEFFRQGDKEKEMGLPPSPLCDRTTTHIAESQIGFIDFIVAPSLDVCGELLDKVYMHNFGYRRPEDTLFPTDSEAEKDSKGRPKSLTSIPDPTKTPTTTETSPKYLEVSSQSDLPSATASTSRRSIRSAPPPKSPRTYSSDFARNIEGGKIKRPWTECLEENRTKWQGRATEEAARREREKTSKES